jgi:antirestriction protein ArdC
MRKGYQKIVDRLIAEMEKGKIPWKRPWITPMNAVSKRPYRGINYLSLASADFNDPRYLTYLQAQKLGGNVKQGAHGFPIVKWIIPTTKDLVRNPNAKPWIQCFTVFNVEQCENLDKLPALISVEHNPLAEAQAIIDNWAGKPEIETGGFEAGYNYRKDRIIMPEMGKFKNPEAYYDTMFHELIHATGDITRLDRERAPKSIKDKYAYEELIAEVGGAMLCSEAHIDNSGLIENNAAYLQSWLKAVNDDPEMIIKAASEAAKAVDLILGRNQIQEDLEIEEETAMQVA